MDYIAGIQNLEKSGGRLLLVINEEPRLSLISEGLNSLVTIDEYLMTTHQVSANVPGSSEGVQTLRQVSKCSLEGPGGTSEDLSIVSLSEIMLGDEQPSLLQQNQLSITEQPQSEDNDGEDVLTLRDVVVEEKPQPDKKELVQSAPQIPVLHQFRQQRNKNLTEKD